MNKYDNMLELNKKKSEEKVTSAVNTIREMVVEKEKVSIPNGTIIMKGGYKVLNHDEVLEILKNSL